MQVKKWVIVPKTLLMIKSHKVAMLKEVADQTAIIRVWEEITNIEVIKIPIPSQDR